MLVTLNAKFNYHLSSTTANIDNDRKEVVNLMVKHVSDKQEHPSFQN